MGLKANPQIWCNSIQSLQNYITISIQMCTRNVILNPTTSAIFRISDEIISSRSIQYLSFPFKWIWPNIITLLSLKKVKYVWETFENEPRIQ